MALFRKPKESADQPATPAAGEATTAKTPAVAIPPRVAAILVKPLISEKASVLHAANKYTFMVGRTTTKNEVKKAIQAVYGVKPVAVQVMVVPGKTVRRGRVTGRRKSWKKAIVTLAAGESIKIFEDA